MIGRREVLSGLGVALAAAADRPVRAASLLEPAAAGDPWSSGVDWMHLWPGAAPGAASVSPAETINKRPATDAPLVLEITGIKRPRLVVLRPQRPNGSAALVMPGGGYARVVTGPEGPEIARWLTARGWTVFVLLYRLPGEGWANRADVPLQDAQRAIRLIRKNAAGFGVNPERIAAIGSSAGGHLCADLATRYAAPTYSPIDAADALSARPNFAALLYPVQTLEDPHAHRGSRERLLGPNPSPALIKAHSPENNIAPGSPPFLIMHAEDDPTVPVENSLRLRSALRSANIRVETHIFPDGGHGFGISRVANVTTSVWPELLARSAKSYGLG
jgi:acetyl esterase/lipase